ncbi:MAG: putative metallopeptidase [Candidatus Anstonellaceae archaeon]
MEVEHAPDVQQKVEKLISVFSSSAFAPEFSHINQFRIICMRSKGAKANAYARIWNLPAIWQKALSIGAFYIIEVISHHYDSLSEEQKEKVLLHELMHIPKTFSGALRPHNGKVKIDSRTVDKLHRIYLKEKALRLGEFR